MSASIDNIRNYIDVLFRKFEETPLSLHYTYLIGIEALEQKVKNSKIENILYTDFVSLKLKTTLSNGLLNNNISHGQDYLIALENDTRDPFKFAEGYVEYYFNKLINSKFDYLVENWNIRIKEFNAINSVELIDFGLANVSIPNYLRDYLLKSVNGPSLLYKLTLEKSLLESLGNMSISNALIKISKFEKENFKQHIKVLGTRIPTKRLNFNISLDFSSMALVFWIIVPFIFLLIMINSSGIQLNQKIGILIMVISYSYLAYKVSFSLFSRIFERDEAGPKI